MRIAGFVEESIVDGPGFRIVIFFQGCAHHCYGCHNPETWDFEGGKEVSFDLIKKIIDDNPYAVVEIRFIKSMLRQKLLNMQKVKD